VVQTDATTTTTRTEAASGITDFDVVVVAVGADFESNLLITTLLRKLGVRTSLPKRSRPHKASNSYFRKDRGGQVLPEQEAGQRLANRLLPQRDRRCARDAFNGVDLPDAWS